MAFPVNPYCWSKSAEHDVILTSLTADLLWPGTKCFDTRRGIVARRGMASFKAKFTVLQELFTKNHRGEDFAPPPSTSGARVNRYVRSRTQVHGPVTLRTIGRIPTWPRCVCMYICMYVPVAFWLVSELLAISVRCRRAISTGLWRHHDWASLYW